MSAIHLASMMMLNDEREDRIANYGPFLWKYHIYYYVWLKISNINNHQSPTTSQRIENLRGWYYQNRSMKSC
uniref:Uncharacterized protein n=1 Tax=Onchocerca volvulus TaxID=6282 RepID=A0A8R1XZN7_ONCVO